MISFASDYIAGAHPRILQRLSETNLEMLPGYGSDVYTRSAADKIRKALDCPEAEVFFLTGGTQTNQLVISTMLDPTEGVISADTGHVNAHEAGAIEYTGHKVLALPGKDGKLSAETVKAYLEVFYGDENHEHMVFPGMVYISFPTEYGTLYSKAELQALSEVTRKYRIPLYVDGARLGYGLMSPENDLSLPELAALADVFYIGGTKVGALCGEALVFTKNNIPARFLTQVKQHGALNAKGRLIGVQFDTLFTDKLYLEIGRHGIEKAEKLKRIFRERGFRFFLESPTNQQFVILENRQLKALSEEVEFSFWEPYDGNHTVVRFATSWSTTDEHLEILAGVLDRLNG